MRQREARVGSDEASRSRLLKRLDDSWLAVRMLRALSLGRSGRAGMRGEPGG